jgi:ferric-dicitrate binding protein FerR (iron transport regulator)
MTCIEGGPDHIRERSDWHQCYLSPEKSKNKPRKTGGPGAGWSRRLNDGTLIRFQDITPSDSAEIVAAKESNNRAFEAAQALKHQSDLDAKAEKDEARKALKEIKAQARRQEKEAEVAAKLAAGVQKLREYTASLSTKVESAQQLPNQSW